ncbi:MAG: hypothetical protein JJU11_12900 [Candidatus Sumerlaeia bacterium]|nr:hypothetical protein [Candidatus Sumerlaeia bacterium]
MDFARKYYGLFIALGFCAFLLMAGDGRACLWDKDTLAEEGGDLPDVVDVIVGRYDLFPAEYYQARLERVTKVIEEDRFALPEYDDAAVACDRLGRFDEAIVWMERKRAVLDEIDTLSDADRFDHEYRYLANLGTFYAHRWVASGADREDLADLQRGRDLIAEAIEFNPDAHFGRERYQLFALEWLLDPPNPEEVHRQLVPVFLSSQPGLGDRDLLGSSRSQPEDLVKLGFEDAIEGISGLVTLGAAGESVDTMHTLAVLLQLEGRSSMAYLASRRTNELRELGRETLHPTLMEVIGDQTSLFDVGANSLEEGAQRTVRVYYEKARKVARAGREARNAFILEMHARGEHRDTHPEVWARLPEFPPLPPLPDYQNSAYISEETVVNLMVGSMLFFVLLFLFQDKLKLRKK